jgi:hypothetical protein
MTREEAVDIIKSECYVFNPLNFDRSTMVNTALDMAIKALEQQPKLEKDGTLIITTEHYENVNRVLVQHGINGTLFYQDQEPCDGTQTAEAESTLGKVEDELYDLADSSEEE